MTSINFKKVVVVAIARCKIYLDVQIVIIVLDWHSYVSIFDDGEVNQIKVKLMFFMNYCVSFKFLHFVASILTPNIVLCGKDAYPVKIK